MAKCEKKRPIVLGTFQRPRWKANVLEVEPKWICIDTVTGSYEIFTLKSRKIFVTHVFFTILQMP